MRNPDGTLVHPPKQKSLSVSSTSPQQKTISSTPKPHSNNLASHESFKQDARQQHDGKMSLLEFASKGSPINSQVPVKKKKMNIKSINPGQPPKSITSTYSKTKKVQKVLPPGSIGLQQASSIKLTNNSQGKATATQVVSFPTPQNVSTPSKGLSITDRDGISQQVQLKTVETSPNSMIKDLSQVQNAEEKLKKINEAVTDAMKTSLSRATQLQLPKSTTATKVSVGKQPSSQTQQSSTNISNTQQSKPKSSSSTSSHSFSTSNRSSSPHLANSELKIGSDVTMTKASSTKSSGSSSYISNSAKASLEAVAEYAAAAQAAQAHSFDLAQYIEMFTKASVGTSQTGKANTPSSTAMHSTHATVAESRNKSTSSPSPNSKLIQSANKAVNKAKQSLKTPDNSSNQPKRSGNSNVDTPVSNRTTSGTAMQQSTPTSPATTKPKSNISSSSQGGELKNKSNSSKAPSTSSSRQPTIDTSLYNEIYAQMQLAIQQGDEKTYTQLLPLLEASMRGTSSLQSASSPSATSSKPSSNSNSPSASSSIILKSEKPKGGNMQSGNNRKSHNTNSSQTVSKPSGSKTSTPNVPSTENSNSTALPKGNQKSCAGSIASILSVESLAKPTTANSMSKTQTSANKVEVVNSQPNSSFSSPKATQSHGNELIAQKVSNMASSKHSLLTTNSSQQKESTSQGSSMNPGVSVLKSQMPQPQRMQSQIQGHHMSPKQQVSQPQPKSQPQQKSQTSTQPQQPQKKMNQQKSVQIMNVSSSVSKGDVSPQQKPLQTNYYQISPATVQIATSNSPNQPNKKEANVSAISSASVSNYLQKPSSTLHQSRVAASTKSTSQTVSSFSNINQTNVIASSSNLAAVQQVTQVNPTRQISVTSTPSMGLGSGNISGGASLITTSSNNTLTSPMSIQQQKTKRLSAADTTQILSSLQPCQPSNPQPSQPPKIQIGLSNYNASMISPNNSSPSSQKVNRSPQTPSSNVSVTLPFSNQVSVTSPQFQANVIHVNQAPSDMTNQTQSSFTTAKNLTRISVTQPSLQRSQNVVAQGQSQLQQQLSSPATITPVLTSPIQGYAKVSPSSYQTQQQISPNTQQVQQIISPSHGMSVTPIQQKAPSLGLTIQQAGSSTMTSVTPNNSLGSNRKLSSSSLPTTPAISITGISASSPMNVSLEAIHGTNSANLYNTSSLQGSATIALPTVPTTMNFNNKTQNYQQQNQQQQLQQQVQQQQTHSINVSNKGMMQNISANNINIGAGTNVRQIQMQTIQPQQQTQSNMSSMYNNVSVGQQYNTYGGQQHQAISPQQVASQQQGATLITVSPSHPQTVQISPQQFQGLGQTSASHVNIPMHQTSQQGTTVTLQQQQHSSRGDLQTPPPFSFSYSQLSK